MRRPLFFLFLLALSSTLTFAQQPEPAQDQAAVTEIAPYLSQQQIAAAVDRGLNNKSRPIGIHTVDMESAVQAGMSCNKCGGATYSVNAYTPVQWIESRAALYKKNNRPFTVDSVTPLMRGPGFRVFIYQIRRALGKMELPDPIQSVQLTDSKQKVFLKPANEKESDARGQRNDSSGSMSGSSEATVFDMKEVDKLSKDNTSDIYVVITTRSGHSDYVKIKAQDLKE